MNSRDRIVNSARELFWRQGFNATSVAEILAAADVRSGSLYYAFDGKEDVLVAVLENYLELLHPVIVAPAFARTADPIERIFEVLDVYRQGLLDTGCKFACPIGRLALEISDPAESVRCLINDNFGAWTTAIETCLDDAADRLPDSLDRAGLARFILAIMEGAVMQAASARSVEPLDASIAHLRFYLASLETATMSLASSQAS